MNLYQYISPPPSMLKYIIYSLLCTYMLQSTREADYQDVTVKICTHRVARGWDRTFVGGVILPLDSKL